MHHRRCRHSGKRAVSQQSAETDRQKQKRFETLDDGQINHDQAKRDHNKLSKTIRHSKERLNLVTGVKRALIVKVAAMPLHVLVVVAIAVCAQRLLFGTIRLVEIAGNVSRRFRFEKTGNTSVGGEILDATKRLLPRRFVRLERKAPKRDEHCHQNFLHLLIPRDISRSQRAYRRWKPCQ